MKPKTAVVTGASRGIGKEIALKLAEDGYNLILNCRKNHILLQEHAGFLSEKYGIHCKIIIGDISQAPTCKQIADAVMEIGSVDILVHNAGISKTGLLSSLKENEWAEIMNININSCYHLVTNLSPFMISQKSGKILFISSVWGEHGASCEVAYSASKGAVNAFTKALAKELAPSGIAVNALACGMINTDMNAQFSASEKQAIIEEIPAGRIASPKEAAEMASLILKAPAYLTAQVITFDGGWQ